ncbi:hypothetical protein PAQ31011_00813 [Pandoraea aquatica]|uniref:Uncharacterized protein n=1 Tax=Pandoraea aquatica TaxID=2508290 RepID=A0A5E4SGP6_9BURK|nr:hypothetical protein [Pandoraea aquatica]VVD74860.1 hypothetical protein PAQ31011_00813 [Pandoraea aquatica]
MSEFKMMLRASVDQVALEAAVEAAKEAFVQGASRAVTVTVAAEKPALCIGCGAVRLPNGEMPCDH